MNWLEKISAILLTAFFFTVATHAQTVQPPTDVGDGRRVALVIGNAAYGDLGVLSNPVRDATTVAKALGDSGFATVTVATDLNIDAFQRTLREFRRVADGASIAVVYFAGHGMEVHGKNWLIPLGATITKAEDLPLETIPVELLLTAMDSARTKVLVLDACRNNPFERAIRLRAGAPVRSGDQGAGLAPIGPAALPNGMLVMYATEPGATASDGLPTDANSPFARALAAELPTRGMDMRLVAGGVSQRTMQLTGGVQRPFVTFLLGRDPVYLAAPAASPPMAAGGEPGNALRMFNRAKAAGDAGDCQALIDLTGVIYDPVVRARAQAEAQNCRAAYLRLIARTPRTAASAAEIDQLAVRFGVRPETLRTVMHAQGGAAAGYGPDGSILILFEPAVFSRLTAGRYDRTHPTISAAQWQPHQYPRTQSARWAQLTAAYALDPEAAVSATSWGAFQLLGMNYRGAGFGSATEFVAAITRTEAANVRAFMDYIQSIGALDELQRLDWDGFAYRYYGPTRASQTRIATKFAEHYARLMQQYDTPPPAPPTPPPVAPTERPGLVIPDLGEPSAPSPLPLLALALALLGIGVWSRRRAA
ncbi:MAG: N-acetylmuramidase domain-containing protein [Hyphomonadaceae bacterium]|nr:N-acetylmuramidase domain-containing protein [Hyphomonadaceae bacterium]